MEMWVFSVSSTVLAHLKIKQALREHSGGHIIMLGPRRGQKGDLSGPGG